MKVTQAGSRAELKKRYDIECARPPKYGKPVGPERKDLYRNKMIRDGEPGCKRLTSSSSLLLRR
jgi:hypothetical protein